MKEVKYGKKVHSFCIPQSALKFEYDSHQSR